MAPTPSERHEASARHPGRADFDVADRLAIVNLVNAYADGYDHDDFERWLPLFTDDVVCRVELGAGETQIFRGAEFRDFIRGYRNFCIDNDIVPRHFLTNVVVHEQSADRAEVVAYIAYVRGDAKTLALAGVRDQPLTGTARYVFVTVKDANDALWRIAEYTIDYDQTEM